MYRCPTTGHRVQGFVAEDTAENHHIYEPVTCPVCHQIHHVNPTTGAVLGEKAELPAAKKSPGRETEAKVLMRLSRRRARPCPDCQQGPALA